jgi:hypothetical protein
LALLGETLQEIFELGGPYLCYCRFRTLIFSQLRLTLLVIGICFGLVVGQVSALGLIFGIFIIKE